MSSSPRPPARAALSAGHPAREESPDLAPPPPSRRRQGRERAHSVRGLACDLGDEVPTNREGLPAALGEIERYWRRRRLGYGAWYGLQIAGALAAGWLSFGLVGSFALFSLGGAGFVLWMNLRRLRQLWAGFIVSDEENCWQKWRVCVSNTGITFRCEALRVAVKSEEIRGACFLVDRDASSGMTAVVFVYLDEPPGPPRPPAVPYRSTGPEIPPATSLRPLLIPATAAGFEALVSWLKSTVPFERRSWPS